MLKTVGMKRSALGLVLAGVVVGVAGAQVVNTLQPNQYMRSGLFTLYEGETANFHVALDDRTPGPVATVVMRFFDDLGAVKASRLVSLAPGQSATLTHVVAGRYRAQAEVYESAVDVTDRRLVVGSVEVSDIDDLAARTRFVCSVGEGLETGRQ